MAATTPNVARCNEENPEGHGADEMYVWLEAMYQRKSTEEETTLKWFAENAHEYINTEKADTFTVVSFGCGKGKKDVAALCGIVQKLKPGTEIYYRGVDPDRKSLDTFQKSVDENPDPIFKKVNLDLRCETYEAYIAGKSSKQEKANLIFFIDSFCQLSQNPQDVLLHCYNEELSENGVIAIVVWNANDFWFKIREIFPNEKESHHSDSQKDHEKNAYLTVQELGEIGKKNNMNFQIHTIKYTLDVTECFQPNSMEGVMMMQLLAAFSNVSEMVTPQNCAKILEFLSKESETKGNCRVLNGNHGIIIIKKS